MIILGTNSIKDTGYNVANSVRFNKPDVPYLHKALSSGNRKTWTYSVWVKRSLLGVNQYFLPTQADPANNNAIAGSFNANDKIDFYDYNNPSVSAQIITNRVFRDVGSWYHIAIVVDTTQSSANDRLKLFVNGVNERTVGGYSTDTMPALNYDFNINESSHSIYIGTYFTNSPATSQFDGYMSEVVFLDGTAAAIGDLGEFDEDSPTIWKPKDVSGLTPGTNGFYLDFEDSSNLGNDAFGGTDLTEVNLAATDQTTDTCTNNFATINPLDNYFAQATLSEGNTKVVTDSSAEAMNTSTFAMTKGKWYFEVDNISGAGARICGITPTPSFQTSSHGKAGDVTPHTISYIGSGAVQEGDGSGGQNTLATYASYANGDIIGVYMDLDNMKAYLSKNGTLQSSTGINLEPLASNGTGHYMFFVGDNNSGSRTCEANFGNGFQSLSSAVSDDNEYGAFEYSPNITGDGSAKSFYSCCTKNLAEFG
jgi:hypothetical protein